VAIADVEGAGVSAGVSLAEEDEADDEPQTEDDSPGISLAEEDQADEEAQTEDDAPAGVSLDKGDAVVDATGRTLLGLGTAGKDEEVAAAEVSVTGQTVVEIAIVEVTTVMELAGQSVTLAAQLVMVISLVV
jgi:hypothetical protein